MRTLVFPDKVSGILSAVVHTHLLISLMFALAIAGVARAAAGTPQNWETRIGPGVGATVIGALPGRHDGYDGSGPLILSSEWAGVFILAHHVQNDQHGWDGPTGFYPEEYDSPIPAGGSKTWWDIYLWSQNYTPSPPDRVDVRNYFEIDRSPPHGYIGHLVIDEVPSGVTWTGPMDYWFDMTVRHNTFLFPIATVTDPLQGTRFHLTVYTPEPSCLVALMGGIAGLAGFALRRRRR